jgi:hypothetical protein
VTADRARRPGTWSAVAGRTPDGVDAVRRELGGLVVAGLEAVEAGRDALAVARDPARAHAKRIRRARRQVRVRATAATGFAGLAAGAVVAPGLEVAEYGLGAVALVAGLQAVRAGRRLGGLRRAPAPRPAVARPPRTSPAREPLDRLAAQETVLGTLLAHLGEHGAEPHRVAAAAATRLRELGARLTAVDRAHRATGGLDAAVGALRSRLDTGVAAYAALVVAAADAVAADAGLRHPPLELREATDALAGLAAGLRDITAA